MRELLSQRPVLVVDDDSVSCQLMGEILASEGYVIEFADSPEQALERVQTTEHQLIVSDVRMPGMSGAALASRIRQMRADVPILFVTAFPDRTTVAEARALNVPILPKPFAPGLLVDRVNDLLKNGSTGAPEQTRGA